jgi:NADPH:quinone reductase-like Zn-dependent oxidoreductase
VVDHRANGAWPTELLVPTDGRGVDHVIEVVGRLEPSVQALAMEGEIAFLGMLERAAGLPPISPQVLWGQTISGEGGPCGPPFLVPAGQGPPGK